MAQAAMVVAGVMALAGGAASYAGQRQAASALDKKASVYEQMEAVYAQQAEAIKQRAENEARWHLYNSKAKEFSAQAYGVVGEFNRQAAELDALTIMLRAQNKATQIAREGSQVMGKQVARYAKGGVEVSSGTPLVVQSETNRLVEEDIAFLFAEADLAKTKTIMEGNIDSLQARMQGFEALHQAAGERFSAHQAREAGKWRAYEARLDGWRSVISGYDARTRASTARWTGFGDLLGSASKAASMFGNAAAASTK